MKGKILMRSSEIKKLKNNNISRNTLSEKISNIVEVPDSVDGIAVAKIDPILGYDINIENITVWAGSLPAGYICGWPERGEWRFAYQPHFINREVEDPPGVALVIFLAFLVYVAVNGAYPLFVYMSMSIDNIKDNIEVMDENNDIRTGNIMNFLERMFKMIMMSIRIQTDAKNMNYIQTAHTIDILQKKSKKEQDDHIKEIRERQKIDDENMSNEIRKIVYDGTCQKDTKKMKKDGKTMKCLNAVKYVILLIGSIISLAVCIVCVEICNKMLGWPHMTKAIRENKCYFVDMSSLGKSGNTTTRKTLEDVLDKEELEKASAYPLDEQDSYVFEMPCDGGIYESGTGVVWKFTPSITYTCNDVVAKEVEFMVFDPKYEECAYYDYLYKGPPPRPGSDGYYVKHMWYGNRCHHWSHPVCHAKGCKDRWSGTLSWKLKDSLNWQFCKSAKTIPRTYRISPNGEKEEIKNTDFSEDNVQDPHISYKDGWFTNTTYEILNTPTFNNGIGTSISFNNAWTNESIARWGAEHLVRIGNLYNISEPISVNAAPQAFQCMMKIKVKNAQRYEEFATWCNEVVAAKQPGMDSYRIRSTGDRCSLVVGYSSGQEQTISVSRSGIVILGINSWRCVSNGKGDGKMCTKNGAMNPIGNATEETTNISSPKITYITHKNPDGTTGVEPAIDRGTPDGSGIPGLLSKLLSPFTSLFGNGFGSLINQLISGILPILIIAACVLLVKFIYTKCKNQQVQTPIVVQQPVVQQSVSSDKESVIL